MRFLLPLFAAAVSATVEKDGCWEAIPRTDVRAVTGSQGYAVGCPTDGSSSFLEKKKRHEAEVIDICMRGSGSASQLTSAAYADIGLSEPFIIRGAEFTRSAAPGFYTPSSYTLNSRQSMNSDAEWYASLVDTDSGIPWSKLVDATGPFDNDLAGQFVRIVPAVTTGDANGNAFGVELYGCPVSQTVIMSFRFKSSKTAIVNRFGKLSAFINHMTEHVCMISKFTRTPSPCPRIVFADLQESKDRNPNAATNQLEPTTVPTVEVFFRVLPADAKSCTDCRSAEVVHTQLLDAINTSGSTEQAILRAIDVWIEDADPYTCYAKVCREGTLCVHGVCVSPTEIAAEEQAGAVMDTKFTSSTAIDKILMLTPLNVISGVNQVTGRIKFAKNAIQPGSVLVAKDGSQLGAAQATEASSTSNDESFAKRFMIPIIVLSVIIVSILSLLGYKMYKRSGMSAKDQALTA